MGAFFSIIFWSFPETPPGPPKNYVVVTNSTPSFLEAKSRAAYLSKNGYNAEIWTSPNGLYAVTIGDSSFEKAKAIKKVGIQGGVISETAFILPIDSLVERKEFHTPLTSNQYSVVIHSTSSLLEATSQATSLSKNGYKAEIWRSGNGFYAVTIGSFSFDKAKAIKKVGIQGGVISETAYILPIDSFVEKMEINTAPTSKQYAIVTNSTSSLLEAKSRATYLSKNGYDAEIWTSSKGLYAVTAGNFLIDKANTIMRDGIIRGVISEKAYTLPVSSLVKKIDYDDYKGDRYIHIGSFSNSERAFHISKNLGKLGYNFSVFLKENGYYAAVIGPYTEDSVVGIRNKAIKNGHFSEDSYVTEGKELLNKIKENQLSIRNDPGGMNRTVEKDALGKLIKGHLEKEFINGKQKAIRILRQEKEIGFAEASMLVEQKIRELRIKNLEGLVESGLVPPRNTKE